MLWPERPFLSLKLAKNKPKILAHQTTPMPLVKLYQHIRPTQQPLRPLSWSHPMWPNYTWAIDDKCHPKQTNQFPFQLSTTKIICSYAGQAKHMTLSNADISFLANNRQYRISTLRCERLKPPVAKRARILRNWNFSASSRIVRKTSSLWKNNVGLMRACHEKYCMYSGSSIICLVAFGHHLHVAGQLSTRCLRGAANDSIERSMRHLTTQSFDIAE